MGRLATALKVSIAVGLVTFASWTIAANAQPAEDELLAQLVAEGENLFERNCAVCHGADGEGSTGPRLVGNQLIASVSTTVGQIILGSNYMPGFGSRFSDRQIAAVASYVRNSWGNEFGIVTEAQVAANR